MALGTAGTVVVAGIVVVAGTVVVTGGHGVGSWAAGVDVGVRTGVAGSIVGVERGPRDGTKEPIGAGDGDSVPDICGLG